MKSDTGYYAVKERLTERLDEPAPGRVQILTGPRQVGKTHILLDSAARWRESALYLAADAPESSLPGWWELQWQRTLQMAGRGKSVLFVDEAHYLPQWSPVIKSAIDEVYRKKLPLHIVITGSATLPLGSGAREAMTGRFERIELRQWNPRDLAEAFSLDRDEAIECFIRFGSFPGGMSLISDIPRWKAYIRDSIIDPAVGRDILMREQVRKPALLRQIFAVCTGHPSEILSLAKIAGALSDAGTLETIAHYLGLLEEAYLIASVRKYSAREVRRRSSPPKIVPLSNALTAASRSGDPPLPARDPAPWGRWVENACIAFAIGCGQKVHYWREEPLEVDFVLIGSWGKWAIEIKTGELGSRDMAGLLTFCRRWPEFRPLVLCEEDNSGTVSRLGVEFRTWKKFLWDGLG